MTTFIQDEKVYEMTRDVWNVSKRDRSCNQWMREEQKGRRMIEIE